MRKNTLLLLLPILLGACGKDNSSSPPQPTTHYNADQTCDSANIAGQWSNSTTRNTLTIDASCTFHASECEADGVILNLHTSPFYETQPMSGSCPAGSFCYSGNIGVNYSAGRSGCFPSGTLVSVCSLKVNGHELIYACRTAPGQTGPWAISYREFTK